MKTYYVIGNWKTHPATVQEAEKIMKGIVKLLPRTKKVKVAVCPPTLFLDRVMRTYRGKRIAFGSQDSAQFVKGSHTGETLPPMLGARGVAYAIIGHSERRAMGETDEEVSAKVRTALEEKMTAVLCFGERERDDDGEYLRVLEEQLRASLKGVSRQRTKNLIVAYEPVWAIGKSADEALDAHGLHETVLFIHKVLCTIYGRTAGERIPLLYGGSVEPANSALLIKHAEHADVDGFLIGHASLVPKDFTDIIRTVEKLG